MRLTLKLISPYTLFDLEENTLTFNSIKIKKLKYRIEEDGKHCILFNIKNIITTSNYYDGLIKIPYLFSIPLCDNGNSLLTYLNDCDVVEMSNNIILKYLEIVIYNEFGTYETGININNPLIVELEFIQNDKLII